MDMIRLPVIIKKDGTLSVDISSKIPTGEFVLELRRIDSEEVSHEGQEIIRELLRERLLRGGFLVTDYDVPADYQPMTPEERMQMGTMPPGTRESHDIISEERGEY